MNVKTSELGWFYHAPPRPKNLDPVIPPPPSQIPGLSDVSHLPPEPIQHRMMIRESDSKYIRLAKQGGRQNLLCMSDPPLLSTEPVGYPRCEWYYDDLAPPPDNSPKEPYQFMLPAYMVHQSCVPKSQTTSLQETKAETTPYAHDSSTVYEREGSQATNKTMKLPEERPPGYGVRMEKHQQRGCRKQQQRVCDASNSITSTDHRTQGMPFSKQIAREEVDMKRLLSFGYSEDYERQKFHYEQQDLRNRVVNQEQATPAISNTRTSKLPGHCSNK
jgi:hypothetical protein